MIALHHRGDDGAADPEIIEVDNLFSAKPKHRGRIGDIGKDHAFIHARLCEPDDFIERLRDAKFFREDDRLIGYHNGCGHKRDLLSRFNDDWRGLFRWHRRSGRNMHDRRRDAAGGDIGGCVASTLLRATVDEREHREAECGERFVSEPGFHTLRIWLSALQLTVTGCDGCVGAIFTLRGMGCESVGCKWLVAPPGIEPGSTV